MMETERECGDCTLCCELLDIPWMKSPPNHTCLECKVGVGCKIFKDIPKKCIDYDCLHITGESPLELRPDKTNVIFERITDEVYLGLVNPKYPDAWKMKNIQEYINTLYDSGISVVISSHSNEPKRMKISPNHTQEQVLKIVNDEYNKLKK